MSESTGTFECVGNPPPGRACVACGKMVLYSLTFDLSILSSQVPGEVKQSLGPYSPGEYSFCYECVLKRMGAKPKQRPHRCQT